MSIFKAFQNMQVCRKFRCKFLRVMYLCGFGDCTGFTSKNQNKAKKSVQKAPKSGSKVFVSRIFGKNAKFSQVRTCANFLTYY